jgi:hypothetical protein
MKAVGFDPFDPSTQPSSRIPPTPVDRMDRTGAANGSIAPPHLCFLCLLLFGCPAEALTWIALHPPTHIHMAPQGWEGPAGPATMLYIPDY